MTPMGAWMTGKVPIGRKAIAPCQCTGSQQWIQYSTYNKLRRKDPAQWKVCRTCQAPYLPVRASSFSQDLPIAVSLLSSILDNRWVLRSILAAILTATSYTIALPKLLVKFLVSKALWNKVETSFPSLDHPYLVS
jgi:hypothetical protein